MSIGDVWAVVNQSGTQVASVDQSGNLILAGSVSTDTISEETAAAGVTIDGALIKDGHLVDTVGFFDVSAPTKIVRLDAGNVTAGSTRVLAAPDQSVGLSGVVYASTAASTAITGATETETAFDTGYTFAANTLKAGTQVNIRGQGICTATTGAETHTISVKLGSVTLLFKSAINPANNDVWWFDVTVSVRTVGASGTIVACGLLAVGASDTATAVVQNTASSTLDTTATALCACYIDRQAGATDADSARLDQFVVTVTAPVPA